MFFCLCTVSNHKTQKIQKLNKQQNHLENNKQHFKPKKQHSPLFPKRRDLRASHVPHARRRPQTQPDDFSPGKAPAQRDSRDPREGPRQCRRYAALAAARSPGRRAGNRVEEPLPELQREALRCREHRPGARGAVAWRRESGGEGAVSRRGRVNRERLGESEVGRGPVRRVSEGVIRREHNQRGEGGVGAGGGLRERGGEAAALLRAAGRIPRGEGAKSVRRVLRETGFDRGFFLYYILKFLGLNELFSGLFCFIRDFYPKMSEKLIHIYSEINRIYGRRLGGKFNRFRPV